MFSLVFFSKITVFNFTDVIFFLFLYGIEFYIIFSVYSQMIIMVYVLLDYSVKLVVWLNVHGLRQVAPVAKE